MSTIKAVLESVRKVSERRKQGKRRGLKENTYNYSFDFEDRDPDPVVLKASDPDLRDKVEAWFKAFQKFERLDYESDHGYPDFDEYDGSVNVELRDREDWQDDELYFTMEAFDKLDPKEEVVIQMDPVDKIESGGWYFLSIAPSVYVDGEVVEF